MSRTVTLTSTQAKPGHIIVVVNRKGGPGKSFTASNLLVRMREEGPVAAMDQDFTNLDFARFASTAGIDVLSLSRFQELPDGTQMADREEVFDLLQDARERGVTVVVDTPPGIGGAVDMACMLADLVVVPTRPGFNDVGGLRRIFELVERVRALHNPDLPAFTICNFYRNTDEANLLVQFLKELGAADFLGKVWERTDYSQAQSNAKAAWEHAPGSAAAIEMRGVCDYLVGFLAGQRRERERMGRIAKKGA